MINTKICKLNFLTLMSVFLVILCFGFIQSQKLIMVQQLFRHGARYPVYPKNDDYSNYTFDEKSFGQLTTNGKKMHYLLGNKIYGLYWEKLFSKTNYYDHYNQSKFYIKSTDVNRTIQSVQSHMMGILQNLPELTITDDMMIYSLPQWPDVQIKNGSVFPGAAKFHPISIHVEKVGTDKYNPGDFLRTYSPQNCPNQAKWINQNKKNARVQQISNDKKFQTALEALSKQLNKNISFFQAASYYDNYQCAKYLGKKYLDVFDNPEYQYSLNYIHTLDMYMNLYMNGPQISATATGFFNQTLKNIKKIIKNPQQVQWNIYSAHDTTVGNMLAAMNMTNIECIYQAFLNNKLTNTQTCINIYPKYTSNIIFELYQNNQNTKEYYIMIRYNGQYRKITFCNWQDKCTVQQFQNWYNTMKDQNWTQTCGIVKDEELGTYFSIAMAEFAVLITIGLYFIVGYLKNKTIVTTKNNRSKSATDDKKGQNFKQYKAPDTANNMIKQSLLTEQKRSITTEE